MGSLQSTYVATALVGRRGAKSFFFFFYVLAYVTQEMYRLLTVHAHGDFIVLPG